MTCDFWLHVIVEGMLNYRMNVIHKLFGITNLNDNLDIVSHIRFLEECWHDVRINN